MRNSNSEVENVQYDQHPADDIVEQYFPQTNEVNSQEVLDGLPALMGTGTGLSQYLVRNNRFFFRLRINNKFSLLQDDVDLIDRETKPSLILNYSMTENWNDIGVSDLTKTSRQV